MSGQTQPSWLQNRPINRSGRGLGGVLGCLGGSKRPRPKNEVRYPFFGVLFGRSWRPLGAVLGLLGPSGAVFGCLGASWGRLGPFKIRCQNRSKNRYLSRSSFDAILVDFGKENRGKLVPEFDGTSMSTSKDLSYEKYCKTIGILMIFEVQGIEVGSKSGTKIDQKTMSSWKGILA